MTLTEFLLARIAEDEKVAGRAAFALTLTGARGLQVAGQTVYIPARVLAECEAKRRIVELEPSQCGGWETYPDQHYPGEQKYPCDGCSAAESFDAGQRRTLRLLALPYADHEDYNQEWRP